MIVPQIVAVSAWVDAAAILRISDGIRAQQALQEGKDNILIFYMVRVAAQ